MAMLSKKLLVPALCIALGACAFKKDDGPTEEQKKIANQVTKTLKEEQDASAVILKENNVTLIFEDSDPGYYNLSLKWPEQVGTMEIFFDDTLVDQVSGKSSFKKSVAQNQKIKLGLRAYANAAQGGRMLSQFATEVKAPADYMMRIGDTLTNDLEINVHRVYIREESQLITNGYNLTINTDFIYITNSSEKTGMPADYSQIVTYKNTITAPNRTANINITAKKAVGTLFVALVGINGADGKDGLDEAKSKGLDIPPTQATAGTSGTNGKVQLGKPCGGRNKDLCEEKAPKCHQQPTNGGPGADGLPGFDGTNGANGGATGNLRVEIADQTDFKLDVYQRAGRGGRGGLGSPGQVGGIGGAPGQAGQPCAPAKAGLNGKNGTDGQNGKDGANGQLGEVITNGERNLTIEPYTAG